jgi:hypothetical protein
MLFSGVEGSTVLLGRVGERYGEALLAQRPGARRCLRPRRAEGGTEGDRFFVVP